MFTFQVVDTPELLQESFQFRYKIAHDELNRIKTNDDKIDIDEYDKYSIHFVALDDKGKVVATSRLIINSCIGYPTENHMDIESPIDKKDTKTFSEVSRIFISKDIRNIKNSKFIIRSFVFLMSYYVKYHKIDYMYAALEENFLKLLQRININYHTIGKASYYNGLRYPCLISWEKLLKDNPYLLNS